MIKLYDSFSQTLKPLINNNKTINMYLCGPTVYNYVHIGNVRGVIIVDVLHRLLLHKQYKVNYVHNITDIDDKIIQKAASLKIDEITIANKYFVAYKNDLALLNIIIPTILPKVSDYLENIIKFIQNLINKQFAYVSNGDVYFKINKISDYGALAHKKIVDLIPNFRIKNNNTKEYELDFILWKATTVGVSWDSPWGKGRPGWHTECAVFINELFKNETIDFHGGGIDLKFPHHENERAQFIAHNNKELAHIWWHNGHVNIDNKKMSKSLNNFILVKDFCHKYHPNVLRYLILNRDHHQPIDVKQTTIENGIITIKKYEGVLKQWTYHLFINEITSETNNYDEKYYEQIMQNLENNINTTNVITTLEDMVKKINEAITNKDYSKKKQNIFFTFVFALKILGFIFTFGNYSQDIKNKIKKWEQLKKEKNFVEADKIRAQLQKANII